MTLSSYSSIPWVEDCERVCWQAAKLDGKEPKKKTDKASPKGSGSSSAAARARTAPSVKRKSPPPASAPKAVAKKHTTYTKEERRGKEAEAHGNRSKFPPPSAMPTVNLNKGRREGGYSSRAAALVGRAAAATATASASSWQTSSDVKAAAAAGRGTIRAMFQSSVP